MYNALDDTRLTYVHQDLNFLVDYVNKRLSRTLNWCNYKKLFINPAKSEFMVISNRLIETEPVLYLCNDRIICKSSVKDLGLLIDCNLKSTSHVIHVKTKLSISWNFAQN